MSSAPTTTTRKRDKAFRQQALVDAATAVFAEHGYDCATTREIAERAGCSEGLIHRYFNSKRGLLQAILEDRGAHVAEDFDSALRERITVLEEIEQLLLWHLDTFWDRRDFMRVAVSQSAIDPDIGRTVGERINRNRAGLIAERLRYHQSAGRIRRDADLAAAAQAITGLGFAIGFVFQTCFGEDRALARRIMLGAADTIARGLAPVAPSSMEGAAK